MEVKKCGNPNCDGPYKDESEFHRDPLKRGGLASYCKECQRKWARNHYHRKGGKEHKKQYYSSPKVKERRKLLVAKNAANIRRSSIKHSKTCKGKFSHLKARASRVGIQFDLTLEQFTEIVNGSSCHYCLGELPQTGCSLDRKNNSLGYSVGNVVPCCTRCNLVRGVYFSYEEFRDYIAPALRQLDADRNDYGLAVLTACGSSCVVHKNERVA